MSASIVSGYAFGAGHLSPSLWKVETQYKSNGNVCLPNRWFFSSPPSVFCHCKNYPRVLGPWIHHHIFTKGYSYILKGSIILDSGNVLHLKGYFWSGNWWRCFGEGGCRERKVLVLEWSLIWIIIFSWVKSVSSLFKLLHFEKKEIQTSAVRVPPLICWWGAF